MFRYSGVGVFLVLVHAVAVYDSIGSLRFHDGNVNENATNQWFDWLNAEK